MTATTQNTRAAVSTKNFDASERNPCDEFMRLPRDRRPSNGTTKFKWLVALKTYTPMWVVSTPQMRSNALISWAHVTTARLETTLCGIALRNPIIAASGTFGYG